MDSILDLNQTAFDIDGVVVDIATPLLRLLDERYGFGGFTVEDITVPDLTVSLGIPEEIVDAAVHEMVEHTIEVDAEPYYDAAESLEILASAAPLLFITSRPTSAPIIKWFQMHLPGLPQDRYEIIAVGSGFNKIQCLKDNNRGVYIDDFIENCRLVNQAGMHGIVFDRPWNQNGDDVHRVKDWNDILKLFGLN